MTAFIAYLRVSTQKQGLSGLGLEAQQAAIARHVQPGDTVIGTYTEIESGKNNVRPQLQAALSACRKHKATLVIAKLDRLSRNVAFLAQLLEGDVTFVACDNPHASKFMLHILAAVAEHERDLISTRTRQALAAAKARGIRLGGDRGFRPSAAHQLRVNASRVAAARTRAASLMPMLAEIGGNAAHQAKQLNARAIAAPRGGLWSARQVQRLHACA